MFPSICFHSHNLLTLCSQLSKRLNKLLFYSHGYFRFYYHIISHIFFSSCVLRCITTPHGWCPQFIQLSLLSLPWVFQILLSVYTSMPNMSQWRASYRTKEAQQPPSLSIAERRKWNPLGSSDISWSRLLIIIGSSRSWEQALPMEPGSVYHGIQIQLVEPILLTKLSQSQWSLNSSLTRVTKDAV